jgi:hypothetical protein
MGHESPKVTLVTGCRPDYAELAPSRTHLFCPTEKLRPCLQRVLGFLIELILYF